MMKKFVIYPAFLLLLVVFSCKSTQMSSSWRDPESTVSMEKLNKVLVVALLKNETSRRKAEDQMAGYLKGKGVVSYSYLDGTAGKNDEKAIHDKIAADGFDGAITMRLVDVDKEVTYTPGTFNTYPSYYRTFGGYYGRSMNYYSTPDRYSTTKTFSVETNVYSIKKDRIIWTGLTETSDPSGVDKMVDEVAKTVYKQMKKEGFVVN